MGKTYSSSLSEFRVFENTAHRESVNKFSVHHEVASPEYTLQANTHERYTEPEAINEHEDTVAPLSKTEQPKSNKVGKAHAEVAEFQANGTASTKAETNMFTALKTIPSADSPLKKFKAGVNYINNAKFAARYSLAESVPEPHPMPVKPQQISSYVSPSKPLKKGKKHASPTKSAVEFTFKASHAKPMSAKKHSESPNRFHNEALERETDKINAEF